MNEIQEYRKASVIAALGKSNACITENEVTECDSYNYNLWCPDIDSNQREMIEDWLIKEGVLITIGSDEEGAYVLFYEILRGEPVCVVKVTDKSKSIAFMKAFMKYLKLK